MNEITIAPEKIPVINETDICVIGGGCTGVFAAVRAARLGARVTIVERSNRFGGVASNSLVNMWHSIYDVNFKKQIIGGLTFEVMERLLKRSAIADFTDTKEFNIPLNSEELSIELDELVLENNIKVFFHSFFSSCVMDGALIKAVIVQTKAGRGAIQAKYFIDASGDGDLCERAGFKTYIPEQIQPPTTCAKFSGWNFDGVSPFKLIGEHIDEFALAEGSLWGTFVPRESEVYMLNATQVKGRNTLNPDDLTYCEIEGRRQVRGIMDIFRKYLKGKLPQLQALPACIGIRETRHIKALYCVKSEDLMSGRRFEDAIANGTYPVDVHHQDKPGITIKTLKGLQYYHRPGKPVIESRWRPEIEKDPEFYQIPLRSLIPEGTVNLVCAGRMLDAEKDAFGAVRVMVNLNQTGEAAGVVSWHALNSGINIKSVDANMVRKTLAAGGSCIL